MNDTSTIRIMIVDDQAVVRSGLTMFLLVHDDFDLVAEAANGEEAVRLCERFHPDVILMDLKMPRMDGATATYVIRERYPHIQVIVLTSFEEDYLIQDALKAGAIGYLLKNVSTVELAHAIRAAHQGRPTLAPEATQVLIHASNQRGVPVLGHDLTERERDVLYLLVKGQANSVIADALVVSRSTVKFHVSNILAKLHASSRTGAVTIAFQHNLIPPQ